MSILDEEHRALLARAVNLGPTMVKRVDEAIAEAATAEEAREKARAILSEVETP